MKLPAVLRSRSSWPLALGVLVVACFVWLGWRPAQGAETGLTVVAQRGSLDIDVLVGGSLEALESQKLVSEIQGESVKILKIVDEGYQVTEEDVKSRKVLAELDSAKLKQNLVNQEITLQGTNAGYIEAQQSYEIQVNQNKTDIRTAEQRVRFALMDLEKCLGARITAEIIAELGLTEELQSRASASDASASGSPSIDFAKYVASAALEDGTARQELRKREGELLLAEKELSKAANTFEWSDRLSQKGFLTKSERETDQLAAERERLNLEDKTTALDLFKRYEFPKLAEEALGKYDDALQSLIRARKETVSRLAQADAKLKGAYGRHEIEKQNRDELEQQIKNCQLTAKTTGLVVYGEGSDRNQWGGERRIAVGTAVYEGQAIITIPDLSKMGMKVGVHESHIKKIQKGLRATVTADAFPDDPLRGEVVKVGVLPDSQNSWMNPDLKLYPVSIAIETKREWVKPGMSAKIVIHVKRLDDVVFVPLQAVSMRDGKQVVFPSDREASPIEVELGEFNDEFIVVESGLNEGDVILLRAPDGAGPASETPDADEKAPTEVASEKVARE